MFRGTTFSNPPGSVPEANGRYTGYEAKVKFSWCY